MSEERPSFQHRLEAWSLRALAAAIRLLSPERASNLGGWLGRALGPRLPVARKVRANLALAFPEKSEAERREMALAAWDNLGRVAFELPHLLTIAEPSAGYFESEIDPETAALRDAGEQFVLLAGHIANWELFPPAAMHLKLDMVGIERVPNNQIGRAHV